MFNMTKRPRFAKQETALGLVKDKPAFALFMEMGTGKTKVVADEFEEKFLNDQIDDLLIVAPRGVYRNWIKELAKDLDIDYQIEAWSAGAGVQRQRELAWFLHTEPEKPRILLMNVEALSSVE